MKSVTFTHSAVLLFLRPRSFVAVLALWLATLLAPATQALAQNGPTCDIYTNKTTANGLGDNFMLGVNAQGSTVYAATYGGLSISTDGGNTFTNKTTANGLGDNYVYGVYAQGSTVYAATNSGLSISTDGGGSFINKTTANGLGSDNVVGVYAKGSTVYAATYGGGLGISTDGGTSFTMRTYINGLGSDIVLGVYAEGSTVYAATAVGLSISTDGGNTFTNKTTANGLGSDNVVGVYAQGSTVYAATQGGLGISTDGGASFINKTTANGLGDNLMLGVYVMGSTVYAATQIGLSISTNGGGSFTNYTTANGLGSNYVYGVYAEGSTVYAATENGLSFCSPSPIRYVRQGGTGSGSSWADASGDLQSQINLTGAQQVWVAQGTYKPTSGTDRGISFSMKNGVAIYGGFVGSETELGQRPSVNPVTGSPSSSTLSGDIGTVGDNSDNSFHVFNNSGLNNTALLDGFFVTGGNANDMGINVGGGMLNASGDPIIANCSFQSNSANSNGGGLYSGVSRPVLINCSFMNNSANRGGGMFNVGSSSSLTNCSFQNNTATFGGGIFNNNSNPSITNCSFLNNSGSIAGGGICNEFSSGLILTNCSFQDNQAIFGGGIQNQNSTLALANCVLFGNGGSNTFSNNSSSLTVRYSLFDASVTDYTNGGNNLTTTTNPFASTSSAQLSPCSPAINAGSNQAYATAAGPQTDLAGNTRVFSGTIDMGAYEYQAAPNPQTGITMQPISGSSVCAGGTVTASVSVSGTGPFTYQWYKSSLATAVPGQTSATLSLTNVSVADAGSYSVVVTGSCNSVTSTAFSLTVNMTPDAPTLTGVSRTVTQSNTPLPLGQFVMADNGNTLSFSGVSGAIANPPTANINQAGVQSFSVSQTSASGCVSPATAFTITVQQSATTTPASQTVCRSSAVVLSATTTGVRYEWYKNGTSAPFKLTEIASIQRGTATSSLTVVSIQTSASYYAKVFQANGSFTFDGPFVVTVNYGCIAPGARVSAAEVAEVPLRVVLTPNPLVDGQLRAVVTGAAGQPLSVQLLDLRGEVVREQTWPAADEAQGVVWDLSQRPAGAYLLRAQSLQSHQVVKVIKP